MKPCSKNRKLIAWLALDALTLQQARDLLAHLESCEGCRRYLGEISNVAEKLNTAAMDSDIQASESFHRSVVGRLRAAETGSAGESSPRRAIFLNWRVALPAIGSIAVVIAALSIFVRHSAPPSPASTGAQVVLTSNERSDLDPTISNYQMVANRSLEELDELLTRQGNRNPLPIPIYTASTPPRANAPD